MSHKYNFPAIFLIGPTASGKTSISLELAKQFPVEVVSIDSAMVYKDMNIGTCKPSKEDLNAVPHHLIDIIEPSETFDIGIFMQYVNEALIRITERNKIPMLVGGSMLYHSVLLNGIHNFPSDKSVQKEIKEKKTIKGTASLVEELKQIDFETYNNIDHNNSRRVERALEIIRITGNKLSDLKNEPKQLFFDQMSQEHIDYMLSKIPRGRFVEVKEISSMIAWMVSAENSFTTGAVFDLSGGRSTY